MNIKSTECECPRGEFKCSHAAAMFIYGIHNLSRTDVECQWRRKKTVATVQAASQMFPLPENKKDYSPLSRAPRNEDREWLYRQLRQYGKFTGVCWLLSREPEPAAQLPLKTIEEIIFSEGFLGEQTSLGQLEYFIRNVKVGQDIIKEVSALTTGQRDNPAWHLARKGRLTASNFGAVLKAKRVTQALTTRLLGDYDLSRVRAIAWGVDNEEMAIKAFTASTGLVPVQTGVWLHESGVLGASPDGLVGDDAVLECKCPYTHRNETIAEAVKHKDFYLESKNGHYALKTSHSYWDQVQGQLFLAQREYCYFTVWTTRDTVVLKIQRDESWKPNIAILTDFYFHKLFPKIVEGEL